MAGDIRIILDAYDLEKLDGGVEVDLYLRDNTHIAITTGEIAEVIEEGE